MSRQPDQPEAKPGPDRCAYCLRKLPEDTHARTMHYLEDAGTAAFAGEPLPPFATYVPAPWGRSW